MMNSNEAAQVLANDMRTEYEVVTVRDNVISVDQGAESFTVTVTVEPTN